MEVPRSGVEDWRRRELRQRCGRAKSVGRADPGEAGGITINVGILGSIPVWKMPYAGNNQPHVQISVSTVKKYPQREVPVVSRKSDLTYTPKKIRAQQERPSIAKK